MYYIFVFRSRGSAYKFYEALRRERLFASVISTPAMAGGCSLSVKINAGDLAAARRIYASVRLSSFIGVYLMESRNGQTVYTRI